MAALTRAADRIVNTIRRNAWDIADTVREIKKEEERERPNADLCPHLYYETLQGYLQLKRMMEISSNGMVVLLYHKFLPARPWPRNFPIETSALPVAVTRL